MIFEIPDAEMNYRLATVSCFFLAELCARQTCTYDSSPNSIYQEEVEQFFDSTTVAEDGLK